MTDARSGAVVLFTRDLRIHDHAGLDEAAKRFECVAPLFVFDDRVLAAHGTPNRVSFLLESLADLRKSLRVRGADLVVRRGDAVAEAVRFARERRCTSVYVSGDASGYAQEREQRLARELRRQRIEVRVVDTTSVVPPGALVPAERDHYRVFTPYWRRWQDVACPAPIAAPRRLRLAGERSSGPLPALREPTRGRPSPDLPRGGETWGRRRLSRWLTDGLGRYGDDADDLAADATSRLSPYLHFGCVSAREAVTRAREHDGSSRFIRQLCWRDFFLQLLAARPETTHEDMRPPPGERREDPEALARWREGRTGYPIVDAAMRQLGREGWIPIRSRLVAGPFLTRSVGLDWRLGAGVFFDLLVDADVANNVGNWQWIAGTGANPRPNQALDAARQAARFDPRGDYVRRHVPELGLLGGAAVHKPWLAPRPEVAPEYPERLGLRAA